MSREFTKETIKELTEICSKLGFKKKGYYYVKSITYNVVAIIIFGTATHKMPGHIYVGVTVGISYRDIIELYSKLIEEEIVFYTSVISQEIGYLMPEKFYKEWEFVENRDNTKTFEDLLNSIQIYAFKYFEEFKDFNNLFEAFENRTRPILSIHRDIYLPIMYYLKGEKEKGL